MILAMIFFSIHINSERNSAYGQTPSPNDTTGPGGINTPSPDTTPQPGVIPAPTPDTTPLPGIIPVPTPDATTEPGGYYNHTT